MYKLLASSTIIGTRSCLHCLPLLGKDKRPVDSDMYRKKSTFISLHYFLSDGMIVMN